MIEKAVGFYTRASKREKTILFAAMAAVAFWISDQYVMGPILKSFKGMDQEVKDLKVSIRRSVHLLSQKEKMMKEIEQISEFSHPSRSPEEETLALLKHIEELANKASVNLLYVKPAGSNPSETVQKYYMTLESEGQMQRLVQFFYEIESSKLLLRVEKYTLQPAETGSTVIKCSATISKAIIP
ncbi:MAG: hypothetical protein HY587_01700 [Candidatus Omnitrophica bacterium]|nr:hypothetical protein [Candidatus Omnitrophota bacterium]